MFTLSRSPLASPAAPCVLKTACPRPSSPSTIGSQVQRSHRRTSSTLMYTPSSPTCDEQPAPKRVAGPLFGPTSSPSSPMLSSGLLIRYGTSAPSSCFPSATPRAIQRQSYYTSARKDELVLEAEQIEEALITSPSLIVASPQIPLKSCLKSPQPSAKSPSFVKSPRFAPLPMISIKSREGPLWKYQPETEEAMRSLVTSKKSTGKPYGTLSQTEESDLRACRERVPTPFERARGSGWLETTGLDVQQSGELIR